MKQILSSQLFHSRQTYKTKQSDTYSKLTTCPFLEDSYISKDKRRNFYEHVNNAVLKANILLKLHISSQFLFFFFFFFLPFDFCRFCVVIRFFSSPPQRPMTSDFDGFSIPDFIHYICFPILILEKEPVFSLLMFSAKQGNYWYHCITSLV